MPNLSIKNVPDAVVENLRARAMANHRSLQGELMVLVCDAARSGASRHEQIDALERQAGWLTIADILAKRKANPLTPDQLKQAKQATRAVDIIRGDRDSR